MPNLQSLRLSWKLPLFIAGICVSLSLGLGVPMYLSLKAEATSFTRETLAQAAQQRQRSMEAWIGAMGEWTRFAAHNPATIAALTELQSGWLQFGASAPTYVQTAYVTGNPNPVGEREKLLQAADTVPYNEAHGKYHPYFLQVSEHARVYDLFVINLNGDIIYTVEKEGDIGQNLQSGPLATSNLAEVFNKALAGEGEAAFFSDFAGYAPSNGAISGFSASAIVDETGRKLGVIAMQFNIEAFESIIKDHAGIGDTGIVYAVGRDGILRTGTRLEGGPVPLTDVSAVETVIAGLGAEGGQESIVDGLGGQPSIHYSHPFKFGDVEWIVVAEQTQAEAVESVKSVVLGFALEAALAVAFVTFLGWLYTRTVTNAIGRVRQEMSQVAGGGYDVEITDRNRGDEIGDVARVLVGFRDQLAEAEAANRDRTRMEAEQQAVVAALSTGLVKLSSGDLTCAIHEPFIPEYEKLRIDFNKTLDTLNKAMSDVMTAAGSIKHGALEISQASDDLSNRTENQAATLEETAAALDELTASVRSAASGAKSVEQIVSAARSDAEQSGKVVQNAVSAMTEIERSSEQISQIVGVIEDIAFQTNLLALNAGVEAARAGDAGKGFAVVASEVRALAQRSSEAAKEIKALIRGSSQQVENGVELVGKAGDALAQIVQRVAHISNLMSEMATGATEQATGLNEINIGVTQLDQVTQQNAAMVEQSTAASHNLNKDAERLTQLMERFRTDASIAKDNGHAVPYRDLDRLQSGSDLSFDEASIVPIAVNSRGAAQAINAGWQDF